MARSGLTVGLAELTSEQAAAQILMAARTEATTELTRQRKSNAAKRMKNQRVRRLYGCCGGWEEAMIANPTRACRSLAVLSTRSQWFPHTSRGPR